MTITPQEQELVAIITDDKESSESRLKAVKLLSTTKSSIVAQQLASFLSSRHRYDIVTEYIVWLLGKIGDPVALPAFDQLELNAGEDNIFLSGKLCTTLHYAIEACKKNR
jgi:hypothetical protein